jgi:hypothetical protein
MLSRTVRNPWFALLLIAAFLNATSRPATATPQIVMQSWSGQIDFLDDPSPFAPAT